MSDIIAVDFDGTLCANEYPGIGAPNEALLYYLRQEKRFGSRIILWTCRVGERLEEAVAWCKEQGLEFEAVNENLPEVIERHGGDSRKIFADFYIDDKTLLVRGVPYKRAL